MTLDRWTTLYVSTYGSGERSHVMFMDM